MGWGWRVGVDGVVYLCRRIVTTRRRRVFLVGSTVSDTDFNISSKRGTGTISFVRPPPIIIIMTVRRSVGTMSGVWVNSLGSRRNSSPRGMVRGGGASIVG